MQTLSLTKDTITKTNIVNEWKMKYKRLEEELYNTIQQYEQVSFYCS
jgi:hypothetical protein